ncbi:MAG: NUDIX domain-containing protein [Candidatus Woesearchaeota archaeon]
MNIEHPIQKKILLDLIHKPSATFAELLGTERDSSKFSYHLTKLESDNMIRKRDGKYSLSDEGRKESAFIEGDTGSKALFPTFANVLIVRDGDKILVQKRLKEPFYGYWGLISGKINFGFNIEECAKRDLEEETGLVAGKSRMMGINQAKTFEDGKLIFHHMMFYVRLDDLSGELKNTTHKGENEWVTVEEFMRRERFPDPWLHNVLNTDKFIHFETERIMKDGKFIECKINNMNQIM